MRHFYTFCGARTCPKSQICITSYGRVSLSLRNHTTYLWVNFIGFAKTYNSSALVAITALVQLSFLSLECPPSLLLLPEVQTAELLYSEPPSDPLIIRLPVRAIYSFPLLLPQYLAVNLERAPHHLASGDSLRNLSANLWPPTEVVSWPSPHTRAQDTWQTLSSH